MILFGKGVGDADEEAPVNGVVQHASWYKKFGYGSALALTFFVVPLAVQAVSGGFGDIGGSPEQPASGQPEGGQVEAAHTDGSGDSQHMSAQVESSQTSGSGGGTSNVDVNVNGQDVPVPQNGSVNKKFVSDDGHSVVDVHVNNGSSNSSSSVHSSTNVQINSQSFSSSDEDQARRGVDRRR